MTSQNDEIACAVLHRDSEGRTIPCPGYPHRDETDGTITMPVAEFRELDLDAFMQGFLAALAEVRGAWETETHRYPSAVELTGVGEKGAPDAAVRFEMRDGVPEVVDFRITAKPNGRAVRTADLRNWSSLEGLALNAFRRYAAPIAPTGQTDYSTVGPQGEREHWQLAGELNQAQAQRRGPSQAELEDVTRVYRDAIEGRPTEAVQMTFGYSRRTAARRVEQARAAGLLPATSPGKKKG